MRFLSTDPFLSTDTWGWRMGRPVANEGFFRALVAHGGFEGYDFFCPDTASMEAFQERLEEVVPEPELRSRVRASLHVALGEALRSGAYEVIHLGDFTSHLPHLVAARNRLSPRNVPVTGITHSLDTAGMAERYVKLALAGAQPWDAVICTSETARAAVAKGLGRAWTALRPLAAPGRTEDLPLALERIPLGLHDAAFEGPGRDEARALFGLTPDTRVLLSVGRISLRNKADWSPILETLGRLLSEPAHEDVVLVIAGGADAAGRRLLEALFEQVGLTGRAVVLENFKPELKAALYRAADLCLSLVDNFQETFGISILEAQAAGLPLVVSDFDGYRELVEQDVTGLKIPTTWTAEVPDFVTDARGVLDPMMERLYLAQTVSIDLDALEHGLRDLLADAPRRAAMGAAAREAAEPFRWSRVIERYHEVWGELAQRAAASSAPTRSGAEGRAPLADLLRGDPAHDLSHWPTHLLGPGTTLHLTDLGHAALAARQEGRPDTLTRYEDVSVLLFTALEDHLATALLDGPATLAELRSSAHAALGATKGQVDFHVAWALKHGTTGVDRVTSRAG